MGWKLLDHICPQFLPRTLPRKRDSKIGGRPTESFQNCQRTVRKRFRQFQERQLFRHWNVVPIAKR